MRYLFINSVYGIRSTGKLIAKQCKELRKEGNECLVGYGRQAAEDGQAELIRIGSTADFMIHAGISRIADCQGRLSGIATRRFIRKIEDYDPDVIWMHNLHGYYLNYEEWFSWLKTKPDVKKFWTLHDCWAFTGHCAYFTYAKCDAWKHGCGHCPQKRSYPVSYVLDNSKNNLKSKEKAFRGVRNLTIVTPSKWLADLTAESILGDYPVEVVHNEIDRSVFCPRPGSFRGKMGLENKKIVLGVAVGWEETKGLPDILELRKILDDTYVIVLVGATKKQIQSFPDGVIGLPRVGSQTELAQIYTAADVFINPTHQDNYPTVNLEARACGTPVVTYDVGGSPESAGFEYVVQEGNIRQLRDEVVRAAKRKSGDSANDQ